MGSQGLSQNEIGCARISMMARSTNAPCKGRIQMRKTNPLHLLTFGLQRTAGPYRWVKTGSPGAQPGSRLCPQERTWSAEPVRSGQCHFRTSHQICHGGRRAKFKFQALSRLRASESAATLGKSVEIEVGLGKIGAGEIGVG